MRELNNQLVSIRELAAIPLDDDVEPAARGVAYTADSTPDIRADVATGSKDADAILAQAPQVEERYIVVPEIPREVLD